MLATRSAFSNGRLRGVDNARTFGDFFSGNDELVRGTLDRCYTASIGNLPIEFIVYQVPSSKRKGNPGFDCGNW